jgi:hypothetical protein
LCYSVPSVSSENFSWNGSFSRVAIRQSVEGEGSYPAGGVGYPLTHPSLPFSYSRPASFYPNSQVGTHLIIFEVKIFVKKHPPIVAPEGDLVFRENAESPLNLFKKLYIYTADWGVEYEQKSWKSFLRVEAT